eukprot:TRINITY_DN81789_c0_g1_i1.p1 TRINITY_DN81789_c0_g1~~TRINITY_DN81789_c0_g1_i1.p1  ORF type:complete len:521 (-),score=149.43 TRINITY_DN81789_c0_g1_i1:403-1965(-)
MVASEGGFARLREAVTADAIQKAPDFSGVVKELRTTFMTGKTKDLAWRRSQLEAMQRLVSDNHKELSEAVRADHGGAKIRGFLDVVGTYKAAEEALANLKAWTAPESVKTPFESSPTMLGRSYIRREPKGVILIIAPWNFPVELALHPVVAAIAAGNCVVLKPSEVSTNSEAALAKLLPKYFDQSCIRVVTGGPAETQALLKEKYDHIFYTGNGDVGRIVMKAAAEHLTPTTLELGGKTPVVVDKSAKMDTVIQRLSFAKWSNCGQICVAPDYVLVHKEREQEFVAGMKKEVEKWYGKEPKNSPDYGRIINGRHVNRIKGLLENTKGQIVTGNPDTIDDKDRFFPPTVVQGPSMTEPLMKEEIFGPVLPVVAVDSMTDAVEKIRGVCADPLALYVYSEDSSATNTILDNVTSGGVCINDSLNHLLNFNLPFGGVGSSGHGSYHGKAGFDEFTHKRSVLHSETTIIKGNLLPPPPVKDDMYDMAVKATITGFLSPGQRQAAKAMAVLGASGVIGLLLRSRL